MGGLNIRIAAVVVVWLLVCVPALAQTPAELLAEGDKLMAANQYARALETYQRMPDGESSRLVLDKHLGTALAFLNLARYADVPPEIDKARVIADRLNSPEAQGRVEHMLGQYLSKSGRGDRGLAAFQRAAQFAEQAGNKRMLGLIYSALSGAYQGLEDWERHMYYAQRAQALIENPSQNDRFDFLMSQGISQYELYERDAAEASYREALELALPSGQKRDESFARGELALLYWTFDHDEAKSLLWYGDAIRIAREGQVPDLEATYLLNRGNVHRDTGGYDAALTDYRQAIRIEEKAGEGFPFPDHKNIGQVYRLMGKPREAIALLEPLIAEHGRVASPRHLWQAHMELASAYAALDQRDRAEAEFTAMMTTLEEQRNTSILASFRTGSFAHALSAYDPYDRYIRFLLSGSTPRVAEALDIAERARARGFLESLASVRASVAARLPAQLFERESQVRRGISSVQERLRAPDLPRADREKLLDDLKRAEKDREDFILAMRVEHPALAEARYPDLLKAADLQRQLRPGETAIVFVLGQPNSFRWSVTRDRIDVSLLPPRPAIEKQADSVRNLLRVPSDAASARAGTSALSRLLFDGLHLEGDGAVTIVPHGVLHYIPFEALPIDGQLLIERHAVSYAPSLNALIYLRHIPASSAPFRVLAVGNPAFAKATAGKPTSAKASASAKATADKTADESSASRSGDVENLALLGALPYSARELNGIREMFWARTDVLSGAAATESALGREALAQFPVVHFATHGLVNDQHPKRSGLLLSPEAGQDGLLQMDEIYGLGLRANLVVLSACQTALGKEITGEGIVGLSRAFFYAGARSVVSALWNLNDRFTSEFVERFYRELGNGHAPEEALRQTKLAYLNHPQFGHPFYWSSLVLMGDGTPVLATGPLGQPWWPTALAMLFTLAAAVLTVRSTGR